METYIYSPYECLVKTINEEILLSAGEGLQTSEKATIYPTKKNLPSFIVEKDFSPYYKTTFHANKRYVLLKNGLTTETFSIIQVGEGDQECHIELSQKILSFSNDNFCKKIVLETPFSNFCVGQIDNLCYCLLKGYTCQIFLCDCKTQRVQHLYGDIITTDENEIFVQSRLNDLAGRIKSEKLYLQDGKFVLKERNFIYQFGSPYITTCPQVIPYAFMEAVSCKDELCAKVYLAPSLKSKTTTDIASFFGEIEDFFPLSPFQFLIISSDKNKIVTFYLDDGLICDITDD